MQENVNKWIGYGFLADDAERKDVNGSTVVAFRLACNESFKQGNDWKTKVEYVPCSWWGPRAKGAAQYLKKGKPLIVEGSFQTRTFDDKNGKRQYRSDIRVSNVCFVNASGVQPGQGDEHAPADEDQSDISF